MLTVAPAGFILLPDELSFLFAGVGEVLLAPGNGAMLKVLLARWVRFCWLRENVATWTLLKILLRLLDLVD